MTQPRSRSDVTMELIVGTFMFLILLVVGYLTIVLSAENIFQKYYKVEVVFSDVTGLRKGDNVMIHGFTVGKVRKLQMADDGIHVICSLRAPVKLKTDYRVELIPTSVFGGHDLSLYVGSEGAPPQPEGTLLRGVTPHDMVQDASAAIHDIRLALSEGGVLTNLEQTVANLRQVTDRINKGEGLIGKLVSDDTLYKDIQDVVRDGKTAVAEFRGIAEKLGKGEGTIGKLIVDDSVYTNLQAVSSNLKDITDRLASGKGMMGKLLSDDDTLYKDLAATASSLKTVMASVEKGEGTLGKIVRSDELYVSLRDTIRQASGAVDDFRETTPMISLVNILLGAF